MYPMSKITEISSELIGGTTNSALVRCTIVQMMRFEPLRPPVPVEDRRGYSGHSKACAVTIGQPPRPVRVDDEGRIFELTGERFETTGLAPADVLEALEDERAGRVRPLREIMASHGRSSV